MRRIWIVSAVALLTSPTLAADMLAPYDPWSSYDAPKERWTGQYLGIALGGLRPRIDVPGQFSIENNAFVGGVFAGYNVHADHLVYGLEADAEWSGFDDSVACGAGWTCRARIDFQGSLRARLGVAADAFHLYATGGLAVAHVAGSTTDPGNVQYSDSAVRIGWTVGAGAEIAFNDDWFGRVEYRYTDLGARDMSLDAVYPGVSATSHAVRAGIAYRF